MTLIDTHCHLIDEAFRDDCDAVISRAFDAGVTKMILACCDETEIDPILSLASRYPHSLYPTIGIHPENMETDIHKQLETVRARLESGKFVAIGEVGLDLHWDKTRLIDQIEVLTEHVRWASEFNLPLILHIRDAMPEFLDLLPQWAEQGMLNLQGVLHCYSGNAEQAAEALKWGNWLFGIGGTFTYKKSLVPEVVANIGLERIILETDAPYLAPIPHRGKRNEPAYTAVTCQALAEKFNKTNEEVAQITTHNAEKLFNFG